MKIQDTGTKLSPVKTFHEKWEETHARIAFYWCPHSSLPHARQAT